MARVSLILPTSLGASPETPDPALIRALEAEGHEVELIVALGPDEAAPAVEPSTRVVRSAVPGPAAAAVAGLARAGGDLLIVLDPAMGYDPADLPRTGALLAQDRADLVVASRLGPDRGPIRSRIGRLIRPLIGTSDPLSGLIGMTRSALEAAGPFHAVGSKFSFELLAKVAAGRDARRADLTVYRLQHPRRVRIGWDDIRHLKRLADHRFGNISRLVQFCVVGASGMVVDLTTYALFQWVFARLGLDGETAPIVGGPLHLAVAGVLAVSVAVVWNFTLNRRLTFNDSRHSPILRQFLTYAASNCVSVPLSLYLRLWLPQAVPFFSDHRLAAAVVGIVAATGVSFSMSRWLVFRRGPAEPPGPLLLDDGEAVEEPSEIGRDVAVG